MPKPKLKPIVLTTREGMEAEITNYLQKSLRHAEVTAQMEQAKVEVERRFEAQLNALAGEIELSFAAVHNFCQLHRRSLMPDDKKSFETVNASVAFENTPHSVGKTTKETFAAIAKRLQGLVFTGADGQPELDCAKYVRESDPELNKAALLADRPKLTPEQLRAMGIRFEQDEFFYIRPKSQIVESKSEAA